MRKAAAAALTMNAAVANGVDLAGQLGATAAEMMRARRDPAMIARKRRRAAQRRVRAWSFGVVGSGGATAAVAVATVPGSVSAGAVLALIFLTAMLVYCIVGATRSVIELRARTRIVEALPPPAPVRRSVTGEIRPEMAKLDGYSDGLRHLVGMIGIVEDDAAVRGLRDEILSAADASEVRLRQEAVDLTRLVKARRTAPTDAARQLDGTIDGLRRQIVAGVAGYGQLVSAASEAVAASRRLADQTAGSGAPALPAPGSAAPARVAGAAAGDIEQQIDRLRSLAAGMRELTQG